MATRALVVRLHAKDGQESTLEHFLIEARSLAEKEANTPVWYAIKFDAKTFGIFDAFPNDDARTAHLRGPIATALLGRADELLSSPPTIEFVDIIAAK